MDEAAKSRATFIRSQLDWLTTQPNALKRQSDIRELRRYFDWWSDSLPPGDRKAINQQFSRLVNKGSLAA